MIFENYGVQMDIIEPYGLNFQNSTYMKCVDIATNLYYGSLMCNYYTNEFNTYNSLGYGVYDPLKYGEETYITSPIPINNSFLERLDDLVLSMIERPEFYDENWARDAELTKKNIIKLLKPVKLQDNEWIILSARVTLSERDKSNNIVWKDNYDVYCCTLDKETISNDGEARYLTIELEEYIDNLNLYIDNKYKSHLCKMVRNINYQSEVFEEMSLVLPPSSMIEFFNLRLNISDFSWENQENEKIIICNNNENSYYTNPIGSTSYIRKDYFEKFTEVNTLKYFSFAERYIQEFGYPKETSLHFEIINRTITKEIRNDDISGNKDKVKNELCAVCP